MLSVASLLFAGQQCPDAVLVGQGPGEQGKLGHVRFQQRLSAYVCVNLMLSWHHDMTPVACLKMCWEAPDHIKE